MTPLDKKQARKAMIQKRFSLDEETFLALNASIRQTLEETEAFQKAHKIAIYVSYKHEVDTRELMKDHFSDKDFYVPRIDKDDRMRFYHIHSFDDLAPGFFGVDEPMTNEELDEPDLIIVPLLLFDEKRNRVGYGKGYYDYYMKESKALKVGVAYSFQQVETTEPHPLDVPLDLIITEKGII